MIKQSNVMVKVRPANEAEAFQVILKPVGSACNMACSYCYYVKKNGVGSSCRNSMMSERLLELFIRQYFRLQQGNLISIAWHGGEPLLRGIEFYKKAVQLQSKYAEGRLVGNSLQTNGLLVDENWCRFFQENHFLIGLSLDGPEHIHDRYRRDRNGQGTFSRVIHAMRLFQKYNVEFNVLATINDYSARYPVEIYRFFKELDIRFIQFIPVVECLPQMQKNGTQAQTLPPAKRTDKLITPWSVKPDDYGRFLTAVYDEWVVRDVGRYFVPFFDAVLGNWCKENASLCVIAEECGKAPVLEHDGSFYFCDHYVFPEYRIGKIGKKNLSELMFSESQKRYGLQKSGLLTSDCCRCEYLFLCHGECQRNRFIVSSSGECGHNYLCEGLKLFFRHTESSMRFMRNELVHGRPAENVMWHRMGTLAKESL